MATRGPEIACNGCGENVRLYSLVENDGMVIGCGCRDVKHSVDSMPYEMGVRHTTDDWYVTDPSTTDTDRSGGDE